MKCQLFLIAVLAVAAFASPIPSSVEYDPDCEDVESDSVVEPAPEIGGQLANDIEPGFAEPAIRVPIDEPEIEEEDCEDPDVDAPTQAPTEAPTPADDGECENTTEGGAGPENPCDTNPCGETCPTDCDQCPQLLECQPEDPCLANQCADGCDQPCDECGHLEKCQTVDPTPTCQAETDGPDPTSPVTEAPDTHEPALTEKPDAPTTEGDCEEEGYENEPVLKVEVEAAHVVPDEVFGEGAVEDVEDCEE